MPHKFVRGVRKRVESTKEGVRERREAVQARRERNRQRIRESAPGRAARAIGEEVRETRRETELLAQELGVPQTVEAVRRGVDRVRVDPDDDVAGPERRISGLGLTGGSVASGGASVLERDEIPSLTGGTGRKRRRESGGGSLSDISMSGERRR